MARPEDRTLVLDMLQPFRRALSRPTSDNLRNRANSNDDIHNSSTPKMVPAKLSFDDTIADILDKIKSSPPLKKQKVESEAAKSPAAVSPWQINRYKAEAIDLRGQIEKLDKQVAHQHLIMKEMVEMFENERRIFASEKKSKDNIINDVENRLRSMKSKETDLKEHVSKSSRELYEYKQMSEREKHQLQKEIYDLKTEFTNVKINNNEQISTLKQEVIKLSQNLEIAQKEVDQFKNAYEEATIENQQIVPLQEKVSQQSLALYQAESKLRELECNKKDIEDMKILQKKLVSMPSLEKEVIRLREEANEFRVASRQNLLLEEQLHYHKNRLESLEPIYQNYCDLQKQCLELQRTLDEWNRIGNVYEASEPQKLINKLENLQQRELTLLSEKKDHDIALISAKNELSDMKLENKKIITKLTDVQNVQKSQESLIHRLQKKLMLVSRERDSYRQQLDCYEKELTVYTGVDSQQSSISANNRVENLEKSLQGYRELVAKLEEEIANMKGTPTIHEQLIRLQEEILNLNRDNETLRSHNDDLELQLERNISKIERNKNPISKIIHLTQNPLSKAQDDIKMELEKAQIEIQQLRFKIRKLEANELEMTQKLSETLNTNGPSSEEVEQLKAQLESNKIKSQRMKEIYTSSFQEYRDVCYMLLGYKMDRITTNNYRLSSMFADSPKQYLHFKLSDGELEMVQTDYAGTLSDLVDEHLHRHKSFPVFLSELTLDLFKRTTMMSDTTMQ